MGKPTGFLEYTRREDGRRPAAERVRDWEEFHLPLPEEIRRQQGARCMNCEMCIRDRRIPPFFVDFAKAPGDGGTILGGPTNFPSVGIPGPQVS